MKCRDPQDTLFITSSCCLRPNTKFFIKLDSFIPRIIQQSIAYSRFIVPPACVDQKDERAQSRTFFFTATTTIIIINNRPVSTFPACPFPWSLKCVHHFVEAAGLQQDLSAADDNETPNTQHQLSTGTSSEVRSVFTAVTRNLFVNIEKKLRGFEDI